MRLIGRKVQSLAIYKLSARASYSVLSLIDNRGALGGGTLQVSPVAPSPVAPFPAPLCAGVGLLLAPPPSRCPGAASGVSVLARGRAAPPVAARFPVGLVGILLWRSVVSSPSLAARRASAASGCGSRHPRRPGRRPGARWGGASRLGLFLPRLLRAPPGGPVLSNCAVLCRVGHGARPAPRDEPVGALGRGPVDRLAPPPCPALPVAPEARAVSDWA